MGLFLYQKDTTQAHTDIELFKNISANSFSIRVINSAYILTETNFTFDLVYYIAPYQSYRVTVGTNNTFIMESKAFCFYFLSIKPWTTPEFIEGPQGVSVRLQKAGT